MRWLVLIGGVLATFDVGLVVWPFGLDPSEPSVPPAREVAEMRRATRDGLEAEWAAAILGRPLFEPGRRPSARIEVVSVVKAKTAPRLTGIIVSGAMRRALFAGQEGVALGEGDRLGGFTVTSIQTGTVELAGPEGMRTLYPADDAGFRAELAAARPVAALVGAEEREIRTENDQ